MFQRREAIFWPRTFNLFVYLHSFAFIVARYYRLRLHRRPEPLQVRPGDSFLLPGSEFLVHQLLSGARSDWSCFDPILDGRQNPGGGEEYARSRPPPLPALRISRRLVLAGRCLSLSYTRRMKPSFFNARAFSFVGGENPEEQGRSEETTAGEPTSRKISASFCGAELFHECGGRSLPCVYSACTPLKHTDTVCAHTQSTQQTGHSRFN